jgi:hypothetical protein
MVDRPYRSPADGAVSAPADTAITGSRAPSHSVPAYWLVGAATIIDADMGAHTEQRITDRPRIARKRPVRQTPELIARRLLEIAVYDKSCRVGGKLTLDDLTETEVGDWKMPDFRIACAYAASQGWLIIQDDALTLTTAGRAAA